MTQPTALRKATVSDLNELQTLFVQTIKEVCRKDYTPEQIKVWTASVENEKRWSDMIRDQYVLVAEKENKIIGFATLDQGNYLDFFYVHKDHQGQGIAKKLYTVIEAEALRQGHSQLTSDISKTARLFFEKQGFEVMKEQTIVRMDIELNNFKMKKEL
ncbi:GNAT family N-acetyltransferase [Robertkochia sediminum]|uniref:GNAT family N-acetyltransferase n=1 Tax=Robertkochia sediminum TaxID=2785326 RepID=UPI00193435F0|nr:GNAT family N-acetyltransferase [Robertkochia sediminum]MBL7472559.1 GNAT family N-acetyltransferase [Robertkochia sediminum]